MRPVTRRRFLSAAGLALASFDVRAQKPTGRPKVGILSPHPPPQGDELTKSALRVRLRQLGWIDGETFDLVPAFGYGREDRLPALALELVAKKVDIIWANGPEAAVAAARHTQTVPIVFWGVAYPVEQELVESLAKPGRNVTGVAWYASPEVDGKRIELLREISPAATRLASISIPMALHKVSGGAADTPQSSLIAAQKLGYEYRAFPVWKAEDFEPAFRDILAWGAQAMTVGGTTLTVRERFRIAEFAKKARLPSTFTLRMFVEAGGLVSYAIDWNPTAAQSAEYVDRILRGARPGDLPVIQPTGYEVAVNLKTAAAIGVTIPESILLRADWVYKD